MQQICTQNGYVHKILHKCIKNAQQVSEIGPAALLAVGCISDMVCTIVMQLCSVPCTYPFIFAYVLHSFYSLILGSFGFAIFLRYVQFRAVLVL